jgi:L-ascorbate metabolism protein UlaG (beta-lactamase superfamily)
MTRRSFLPLAVGILVASAGLAGCSSSGATQAPGGSAPSGSAGTAGITIYYEENAQVEIIAPSGRRVLIDVADPTLLSAAPTASDVLLTTHSHGDHYIPNFEQTFPGRKLTFEEGRLEVDDVIATGIASTHDEGQAFEPKGGSNYIFVVEIEGFRIAHFGDIGQDKLTDEQLTKIGKVDIAFSQLSNSFSSMDETNRKGFNLMNQVKPRVLVPTHMSLGTAEIAVAEWKATYSAAPSVTISADELPDETTVLFMGLQATSYGALNNLEPCDW